MEWKGTAECATGNPHLRLRSSLPNQSMGTTVISLVLVRACLYVLEGECCVANILVGRGLTYATHPLGRLAGGSSTQIPPVISELIRVEASKHTRDVVHPDSNGNKRKEK